MVNDVLYGISNALYAEFDGISVYTDTVEQGLGEPCFFVMPIAINEQTLLNRRAYRNISFDIHYISKQSRLQLEELASKLYPLLRRVTLLDGSQLNGSNLRHEIYDGVLHFFVDFKPIVLYPDEIVPNMADAAIKVGIKNEEKDASGN